MIDQDMSISSFPFDAQKRSFSIQKNTSKWKNHYHDEGDLQR